MNRPPTRASSRAQLSSHGSADASIGAGVSSSTTSTKVSGTKRAFADAAAVPNEHAVINIDNDDDKDNNSSNNNGDDASTASTASRAAAVPSGVNPEDANSCAVCLDRVIEQVSGAVNRSSGCCRD